MGTDDVTCPICLSVRITDNTALKSIAKFCYLGSFLSKTISVDSDLKL